MGATTTAEVRVAARAAQPLLFDGEAETMPRERLDTLQLHRLRATVQHAYEHVPMHRARLLAAGVAAEDLRTRDDVRALPFTVKNDLRDHYPFGLFACRVDDLARLHASSGTTGKATVVGYTPYDIDVWAGLMARSMARSPTSIAGAAP